MVVVKESVWTNLQKRRFSGLVLTVLFAACGVFLFLKDGVYSPGGWMFSVFSILLGFTLLKVIEISLIDDEDMISIKVGSWPFVRHYSFSPGDMIVLVEKNRVPQNSFFIYEMRIRNTKNRKSVFHVFRDRDVALHVVDELRARGCHTTFVD